MAMRFLRRTAVRNLERAGVPRSVAMQLTGHRTEAVYRGYAIVGRGLGGRSRTVGGAARKFPHSSRTIAPKIAIGQIDRTAQPVVMICGSGTGAA